MVLNINPGPGTLQQVLNAGNNATNSNSGGSHIFLQLNNDTPEECIEISNYNHVGVLTLFAFGSPTFKFDGGGTANFNTGQTMKWGTFNNSDIAGVALQIIAIDRGIQFPNMTTVQKNAMPNIPGNVVFDTTIGKLCVNNGSAWQTITSV